MIPVRMTPARIKSYFIVILVLLALSGFLSACSGNSSRNHYLLAEKLWTDKNYLAAVSEFERVTAKDPNGRLGRQALYRAASTQMLFLSEYHEALKKFNDYVQKDQVPR